jgi:hypothetical protein
LDRDDETDALKGEDGSTNEQCPVVLVELDNVSDTVVVDQSQDIVVVEIDKAKNNEEIGNQSELLNVVDVAVQAERQEDDHLHQNHVFDVDEGATLCHGQNESLQVFRDKDDIGG